MTETPNLGLPLIAAAQAQKHVTHNEALAAIDLLLHCAVLDRDLAVPPASPAEGARYLVAAGPSGAWAGHAGEIALRDGAGWTFRTPRAGFLVYVVDEGELQLHDGTGWAPLSASLAALQNLDRLGLGTTADATNPFAARLNKALWTARTAADGGDGDLRYTLNKEGTADVLSLLLQSGFSGRCEFGLIGEDGFSLKVSPNGSTWTTALAIEPSGASVAPGADAAVSLGKAGRRWSTVHAATGAISTSDAREKTPVEPLTAAELAAAAEIAREIGSFRFLTAVAAKGEAARRHVGLTVQRAVEILEAHGLSPFAYGFVCRDAGTLGFRADQLLFFLARGFETRLAALEARLGG